MLQKWTLLRAKELTADKASSLLKDAAEQLAAVKWVKARIYWKSVGGVTSLTG
jgi:hypothetical protein